jgi:hypothetical protein
MGVHPTNNKVWPYVSYYYATIPGNANITRFVMTITLPAEINFISYGGPFNIPSSYSFNPNTVFVGRQPDQTWLLNFTLIRTGAMPVVPFLVRFDVNWNAPFNPTAVPSRGCKFSIIYTLICT